MIYVILSIVILAFLAEFLLKRGRARWMVLLRAVVILGALAGLFFWWVTVADTNYIAAQCERKIERRCDPQALQSWAINLMAAPVGFSNGPVNPIFAELPQGLYGVWKHGYTPHISIRRERREGEEDYVYLFWGSAMLGHWGMSIGSPTFVPAPSNDKMRLWKPGVYFWRDPQ